MISARFRSCRGYEVTEDGFVISESIINIDDKPEMDKLGSAIDDYDEAIRLDPQFASAYYNRGLAYQRLGQSERAIKDFNEAIRLNPQYAAAYNNRANDKGEKK